MSAGQTDQDVRHIQANVEAILERIHAACNRAGRSPDEITLVAVTKTFPIEFLKAAMRAGLSHFGENRVQEFVHKAELVPPKLAGGDATWHMIGHLQRNKARDVVRYADVFHSLDSVRLARELNRQAERADRRLPCFVQVNVSGEASKFGIDPDELDAFLEEISEFDRLDVRGLMTLARPADDPEEVRPEFQHLRSLAEKSRPGVAAHIRLNELSMGMSGDFEVAIEEGATHIRIGSAIFGERPQVG